MSSPPFLRNILISHLPVITLPQKIGWEEITFFARQSVKGFRHDLFVAFSAVLATLAFIPIFTYVVFAADLADKEGLMNHNDLGITLLDIKGRPFFTFYKAKFRKDIPLSEVPPHLQQAVIAVEDKDFYENGGWSAKSVVRAAVTNIINKDLSYGASTITQQLVKNSLLHSRKDFLRKYQEIVLASEVARRYSKEEVLEMYLNSVYFGEGAFGVEQAAQIYFDKAASDLTLAESTLLAGILPAPGRMSLISGNLEEARERQELVLEKMVEQKYIDEMQKDQALKEKIKIASRNDEINFAAPHFALMVKDKLIEEYGEEAVASSGYKIYTSLDLDWQNYAEVVVSEQVVKLKANKVSNGAAVAMDPKTGEIRALVGSKDWYSERDGKVNIATSKRPPGSSFKPIVYLRALEKGVITPATVLRDQPTSFANFDEESFFKSFPTRSAALQNLRNDPNAFYKPQNYDRRFRGAVTIRRALANSLNVPAVEVMKKVGVGETLEFAKKMGISTLGETDDYGLSLVLGTGDVQLLELTNAYATLANQGYKNEPTTILKIEDKKGDIIYEYKPPQEKVADEKDVFLISSILSDNKARTEMFGNTLTVSRPAAVKTGTTEDYKDAWTLGYTPSLVVGVWVGNNFGEPMDRVAGSLGAAPIWKALIEKFSQGTPVVNFEVPEGVVKLTACGVSSKEATPSAVTEYFILGTEPKAGCLPTPKPSSTPSPAASSPSPSDAPQSPPTEEREQDKDKDNKKDIRT